MSQPSKRRRFLHSKEITELFLDTDSGDETVSSDASSFQGVPGVPGVSHTQPYRQAASSPKSNGSSSSSASDEDEAAESEPGEQTQKAVTLQWTCPSCPQSSVVHIYTRGPRGKDNEASHINDGSSPLSVFLLYFAEIITLLVVNNRYYHDYIDRLDGVPFPKPNVTEAEMYFWH
jgi:hypothetical protein